MPPKLTQEMKDTYEEFLVEIDMLLEDLQDLLSKSRRYQDVTVGFDDDTLERIEAFYIDVLAGVEKTEVSQARLNRIFIAYVGEAVRNRAGGRWTLDDTPGDPAFGTPVIIDWASDAMRVSPVVRREKLIQDREPFLRELVDYCANKDAIEEDFFKEFE